VGALEVGVGSFVFGDGDEAFAKEDGGCHALLVFVWEVGAGDGGGSGTFAVANGDAAAEGMVDAEGCPGHGIAVLHEAVTVHLKEITPAVPGDFPGIGGEGLVFKLDVAGAKVEAVGGGVDAAGDAVGSFDLGTVKDAVAEDDVAKRSHGDHAAVVSIGDVDAAEEFFLVVGFAIAVGVFHVDEARLVRDDDAVFVEGDAVGDGEVVGEDSGFVGFAIAVGVFENDDLVGRNVAGNGAGEGGHGDDPESALGVEGDLLGVLEFGEFFLGGEEVDRKSISDLELGLHLGGSLDVGLFVFDEGCEGDGIVEFYCRIALCPSMDEFFRLLNELVKAGDFSIVFILASPNSVVEDCVDRANDIGDVFGFAGNELGNFTKTWVVVILTKDLGSNPFSSDLIPEIVEVYAIVGKWLFVLLVGSLCN